MFDTKIIILFVVITLILLFKSKSKSGFDDKLINTKLTNEQPLSFPSLNDGPLKLQKPDVPEEIGLAMPYPQGDGVGMEFSDSNSFYPNKPGPLLTNHVGPESYGESSFTDPTGKNGADQGARVIKLIGTGDQLQYKPVESVSHLNTSYINGFSQTNYSDNFNPSDNLTIQTSPGQQSTMSNCEATYPNVVKHGDFCITEGDIPYGQVVNGKVNPRLVSRWESYTGDYSREEALNPIDGVLYPNLNVLTT